MVDKREKWVRFSKATKDTGEPGNLLFSYPEDLRAGLETYREHEKHPTHPSPPFSEFILSRFKAQAAKILTAAFADEVTAPGDEAELLSIVQGAHWDDYQHGERVASARAVLLGVDRVQEAKATGDAEKIITETILVTADAMRMVSHDWAEKGIDFPAGRPRAAYGPTKRLIYALCAHVGPDKAKILDFLTAMVDELGVWGDPDNIQLEDGSEYLIRTVEPDTPGLITIGLITADYRRGAEQEPLALSFNKLGTYISEFKKEKK